MTTLDYRAEVVDDLAQEIGQTCKDKGFREDWEMADQLEELAEEMWATEAISERTYEWLYKVANTLRNCVVATKLALVCSEIGEALETLRDHGVKGVMAGEGNFGEELADAKIRILEMGDMLTLPLGREVVDKMEKNSTRPHRHGRRF